VSAERTLSEAGHELALPERTLRRYLEQFRAWLPVRRRGRVRVLDADAVAVLRLVREHLVAGKTVVEVERLLVERLSGSNNLEPESPTVVEVERLLVERRGRVLDASGSDPAPSATLARKEDVAGMAAELARLREGVGLLLEHLERERADRERLVAAVEHQAEELARLRTEVAEARRPPALPPPGPPAPGHPSRARELLARARAAGVPILAPPGRDSEPEPEGGAPGTSARDPLKATNRGVRMP